MSAGVVAAWVLLSLALSILAATIPNFTSVLVDRLDVASAAGLERDEALVLAESVRAFVTGADEDPLPEFYRGRPAFDRAATSHLEDVRSLISLTRLIGGAAALILAAWVVALASRKRWRELGRGIELGGWATVALVGAMLIGGLLDFDAAFVWFHGLFFEAGTWTFPADALLIKLFPEPFWVAAGVTVATVTALVGAGLVAAGRRVRLRGPEAEIDSELGEA